MKPYNKEEHLEKVKELLDTLYETALNIWDTPHYNWKGKMRDKYPKYAVCYFVWDNTLGVDNRRISLSQMMKWSGLINHTTIKHYVDIARDLVNTEVEFRELYYEFEKHAQKYVQPTENKRFEFLLKFVQHLADEGIYVPEKIAHEFEWKERQLK